MQIGQIIVYIYPQQQPVSNAYRLFLIMTAFFLTMIALSITASKTVTIKDEL
jgi:hypothetical protein